MADIVILNICPKRSVSVTQFCCVVFSRRFPCSTRRRRFSSHCASTRFPWCVLPGSSRWPPPTAVRPRRPAYGGSKPSTPPRVTERERNVLFNDALSTFYLRLYGVRHMAKDHSDSEKGNPLPPHRLLLSINSKGSFICTIPQTG